MLYLIYLAVTALGANSTNGTLPTTGAAVTAPPATTSIAGIPLYYIVAVALGLVGIAFAGIAADKHFIIILLAVELILVASTVLLVAFFTYGKTPDPSALIMLFSIWAVAAVEIITLITFYLYMKQKDADFDVTRLSKMKW